MALQKVGTLWLLSLLGLTKLIVAEEDVFHPTAQVWTVVPNQISTMGGVITIYGKDFAADNFNQFEPDLGNKVSRNSSIERSSSSELV